MSSRERILSRVKTNQPMLTQVMPVDVVASTISDPIAKFKEVLISIGGAAIEIEHENEIVNMLATRLPGRQNQKIIGLDSTHDAKHTPHAFGDTDIAILRGQFAVAENGSIWVTDDAMIDRALPFICAHLVLVVHASAIVSTMHDAYEKISRSNYDFGTFIAGPSKTADIEQSLVLGAHGAKTLTCFILR